MEVRRVYWSLQSVFCFSGLLVALTFPISKGLPVPLAGSMGITAALFFSYTTFQDVIRASSNRTRNDRLSIPELALAALGAGFVTSYIVSVTLPNHNTIL